MRRNDFFINTATIFTAFIVLTAAVCGHAQPFKEVRQLTSNNIIALAGNGDTLWMATENGFNYRTSTDVKDDWYGFKVNDLAYRFWCMGFGGGGAAAVIYKDVTGDSIGFWHFSHRGNSSQQQKYFKFPSDIYEESASPVGSVVYSKGSFWVPFNRGGLVRYNPADNGVHVIMPGDVNESLPQNLIALSDDEADTKAVMLLDVDPQDSSIIVTTPKKLWRYHPSQQKDNRWESIDTNPAFVDTTGKFVSYDAAFIVNKKVGVNTGADVNNGGVSTLYSIITTKKGGENDTSVYTFDNTAKRWHIAINKAGGHSIFPAVNGVMYTLFENEVTVYADTASVDQNNALSVLTSPNDFRDMLRKAGDDPNPKINYILFLPKTDSSGTLAVATETGLYICDAVEPLSNKYGEFALDRYVRGVSSNEAYALPGVIRYGMDGRYEKCVFVYKLKKDGDVTIKVYDYNMSLVKTVVKGERRRADKSRSTDPVRDVWDGKNNNGKRVWPGVYYFKITSNKGERLFGKVIMAK